LSGHRRHNSVTEVGDSKGRNALRKVVLALAFFQLSIFLHAQNYVVITYVANDGFLISSKSGNVLIDALFNNSFGAYDVPSEQLRADIVGGKSRFQKIDLYLVTHAHGDHFYAPYVIDFLKNHPETRFVAARQVCQEIGGDSDLAGRLEAISLEIGDRAAITVQGVPLKIWRLKHFRDDSGERAVSLVYLIELDGCRILHLGDAPVDFNQFYFDKLGLENEKIDIMFLGFSGIDEKTRQFVREVIKPKRVVAMHIPPKDMEAESKKFTDAYPNGVVFKAAGETRTFLNN
jgi:L-ascorbate metabolism protein UlaG (beta-lactamase superfamily)